MENKNPQRLYSQEDIEKILSTAIKKKGSSDAINHEQLLEVARELGLSEESVEQAIVLLQHEGTSTQIEQAKERWLTRRKSEFYQHLTSYLSVNTMLFVINYMTQGHISWALYPLMGWGIGLVSHAVSTFFVSDEQIERGAQKILRKEQRRAAKEVLQEKQHEKRYLK